MSTEAINQTLAVLLWGKDADGEDDVVLMTGVLREVNGAFFVERGENPRFPLEDEWLPRIKRTNPEVLDVVSDAPFMLTLTVEKVDEVGDSYRPTGLKWPGGPA